MQSDWNPPRRSMATDKRSRLSQPGSLLILVLLFGTGAWLWFNHESPLSAPVPGAEPTEIRSPSPPALKITEKVVEGTIQPGETISSLLGDYFSQRELYDLSLESRKKFPLSGICAGQPYKLCLKEGAFERFEYDIDRDEQLIINRDESGLAIARVPIEYDIDTETVRGTISSSLFEAVGEAGESPELAMILADIFAYDIDFIRDIRQGDTYQVVVEKRFRAGTPAGYGRILAAEFNNQGQNYQAFLFQDGTRPAAYYNSKGESLRTAFLRAPLAFSRISSGFTLRRFHPIAKTWRAHPAIDYAAPTGTPIMAIGDGSISKIGRTSGNGNYIKIRHPNGFETMYLHMSRFAKGMHAGKKLAQGDVIGFVGSTGLATGPHLCFRMFKNGSPINPNKVRTAAAAPISKGNRDAFKASIAPMIARLQGAEVQQAQAEASMPAATETIIR